MKKTPWMSTSLLAAAVCLILAGVALAGCDEGVSLGYDTSPGNIVAEYWIGGGLVPVTVDNVPPFRLYGDGRVVKRTDEGTSNSELVEGKMSAAEVKALLTAIEKTGFFDLKSAYADRKILDGATQRVAINLEGGKKSVSVYMMEVKPFDETVRLLMAAPVSAEKTYVPEAGYLIVRVPAGGAQGTPATAEIASLMPDAASLESAATSGKPLEVGGKDFAKIKHFDSVQEYPGIEVTVGGKAYIVYPVYEPLKTG